MELQYQKAMAEYNLAYKDLPEDAQVGIDNIRDVQKGITMLEKKGKQVQPKTLKKISAMDKWVYYEILDHVQGTDENDDDMGVDAKQVVKEIKQQAGETKAETVVVAELTAELTAEQKKALAIENELEAMHKSGRKEWDIDSINSAAPKAYAELFEAYDEDDKENGVETSRYRLVETDDKIFTITKK